MRKTWVRNEANPRTRTQVQAMVQNRRQVSWRYLLLGGATRTVWISGVDSLAIFSGSDGNLQDDAFSAGP